MFLRSDNKKVENPGNNSPPKFASTQPIKEPFSLEVYMNGIIVHQSEIKSDGRAQWKTKSLFRSYSHPKKKKQHRGDTSPNHPKPLDFLLSNLSPSLPSRGKFTQKTKQVNQVA